MKREEKREKRTEVLKEWQNRKSPTVRKVRHEARKERKNGEAKREKIMAAWGAPTAMRATREETGELKTQGPQSKRSFEPEKRDGNSAFALLDIRQGASLSSTNEKERPGERREKTEKTPNKKKRGRPRRSTEHAVQRINRLTREKKEKQRKEACEKRRGERERENG